MAMKAPAGTVSALHRLLRDALPPHSQFFCITQVLKFPNQSDLPVGQFVALIEKLRSGCRGLRFRSRPLGSKLAFQFLTGVARCNARGESENGYGFSGEVFRRLLRIRDDVYESSDLGEVTSRMSSINSVQAFVSEGIASALIDGIAAAIAATALVLYSPKLGGITYLAIAFNALITALLFPHIRRSTRAQLSAAADERVLKFGDRLSCPVAQAISPTSQSAPPPERPKAGPGGPPRSGTPPPSRRR